MSFMSKKEKGSGNVLSFLFSIFFFVLFFGALYYWNHTELDFIDRIENMSIWEAFILSMAIFRMTRLLVYDKIMNYVRDIFLDTEEHTSSETGIVYIVRHQPKSGFRRLISELLVCPWCASMWLSLIMVFFHFSFPEISWPLVFVLALGGFSSMLQLTSNTIGWYAEGRKCEVEMMKKKGTALD